jgi:predicted permease
MAQGRSRDEARAEAVAEFGDVDAIRADLVEIDQQAGRRQGRLERLDAVRQDLVYAARALRRTPAVSLTIILTLALGLGANAAMFSLLDVIYLRPPAGVTDADAVQRVWSERRFSSGTQYWSGFDYAGYAAIADAVEGRAAASLYLAPSEWKLARGENAPTVNVSAAAANYFKVLGLRPLLGRFYLPDEDGLASATPVAVISEHYWRRAFDGSPDVLGTEISLRGQPFTIVGVAPAGFRGIDLDATDVWVPIAASLGDRVSGGDPWWRNPNVNGFQVVLRLQPGVGEEELLPRLTQALRGPGIGWEQDTLAVAALGAINAARGPGKKSAEMKVATRLAGVALIVLLIAVANVVNLLLARAVNRRRELAVRLALGITRRRLVGLLVTESVLLALAAGAAALAAAWWGSAVLRALLLPGVEWHGAPLHWRVLLVALGAALVAGTAAGLVPALQAASPDLTAALKAGARAGAGSTHRARHRSILVAPQAAHSVVLHVGALL